MGNLPLWCRCGSQDMPVNLVFTADLVFIVDLVPVIRVGNKENAYIVRGKEDTTHFRKSGSGRVGVEGKTGVVFSVGNGLRNQAQAFIYSLPSEVTYSSKTGGEQKWHIYQR